MALKLKVHWREVPLSVQYRGVDRVIDEIRESNSPYVDRCGNNDALVKDFFEKNNIVPDDRRYHIGNAECYVSHDNKYRICNDRYLIPHCDIPEFIATNTTTIWQYCAAFWNPHMSANTNTYTGASGASLAPSFVPRRRPEANQVRILTYAWVQYSYTSKAKRDSSCQIAISSFQIRYNSKHLCMPFMGSQPRVIVSGNVERQCLANAVGRGTY